MMCLSLAVSFKITEPYNIWLSVLKKMHLIASYLIRHQPQNLLCIILKLLWFCQLSFLCPLNHWLPKLQHTQQLHCSVELNHLSGRRHWRTIKMRQSENPRYWNDAPTILPQIKICDVHFLSVYEDAVKDFNI